MNDTEELPASTLHCGKNNVSNVMSLPCEKQPLWLLCIEENYVTSLLKYPQVVSLYVDLICVCVVLQSPEELCSLVLFFTHAVCLSVFSRRRVLNQSVLSHSQPQNQQNRSPCWIILCSGVFLMSKYVIQDIQAPLASPWSYLI